MPSGQTRRIGLRHPSSGGRCRKVMLGVCHLGKLQALVYDILHLEEGAGKRCSECAIWADSKRWFTTSFLWRKVPESDARSMYAIWADSKHWFTASFLWRKVPESDARSMYAIWVQRGKCPCGPRMSLPEKYWNGRP